MTRWRLIVLMLVSIGSGACGPTETGNPGANGSVRLFLTAHASDPAVAGLGESEGGATVLEIWISLAELELDACDASESHSALGQPIAAELVEDPVEIAIPAGVYCSVHAILAPAATLDDDVSELLAEHSFALHGERAGGTPFVVTAESELELALAPIDTELDLADSETFFLSFDVSGWLFDIDLDAAAPDAAGVIMVDESSNSNLLDHFLEQGPASASLHHDENRDGELNAQEVDHPVAVHH